jgi:tetratricopeptide (TPR) repeat protein
MGYGRRFAVLVWMCGVVTGCALLRAQDPPALVDLSCDIARETGVSAACLFRVAVRYPAGGTILETYARAGKSVKFRGLKPGILVACVEDRAGASRCESVDLYPPPTNRAARFSIRLRPPETSARAESLCLVHKADLAIPEKARREFDLFMKDWKNGNVAEGVRHLERALAIHPEYPEALTNLGSACHVAGDYARAARLFARVTAISPDLLAGWLNLGVTLLVAGDPQRALQAEMHALGLRPDDPFVLFQVGLCHYRLREFEAARRFFERVIELDPCSATYPHLYLARIALAENNKDEAARLLREVSRLHPFAPHPPGMKELATQLAYMPEPRSTQIK